MMPESPALLISVLLGAALRALIAAAAVGMAFRAFRIRNVLVQKAAWSLVLCASFLMPFAPQWHVLPAWTALRLPAEKFIPSAKVPAVSSSTAVVSPPARPDQPSLQPYSALPAPSIVALPSFRTKKHDPRANSSNAPYRSEFDQSSQRALPISTPQATSSNFKATVPGKLPNRLAIFAILLYCSVAAFLILRMCAGTFAAIRLWIAAKPVTSLAIVESPSPVRASNRVTSPVNIGSGILLPAGCTEWNEEKLRIVLAHECSHVRQGDFYLQLVAGLYACVFWFSPLGWWLRRKLCELGEALSDRAGLEKAASRTAYAQLLLEFAALPRPTLTGVAMARTNHLSHRIERLLDESHFRQAFATGGRRAWLAAVIVPLVFCAASTLVNVQAAASGTQITTNSGASGQSTPAQVTDQAPAASPASAAAPATQAAPAPVAAPAVPAQPAPTASPEAMPEPPEPPAAVVQPGPVTVAPLAPGIAVVPRGPQAPIVVAIPRISSGYYSAPFVTIPDRLDADTERLAQSAELAADLMVAKAQQYLFRTYDQTSDGDPYALVDGDGKIVRPRNEIFSSDAGFNQESINKARSIAHGAFLWFEHEGKAYVVDDPTVVAQIQAMQKPMDDLRGQMQALGKQMRDLGDQQRDLGKKMREITVPTPDVSKEIADLNAAAANLKAKEGATISQKDLSDMQREIGRIQGQLGQLQGRIGAQQGDLGGQMGKFGSQMGELGRQMGDFGKQMGELARQNQTKMKSIITDSLSNGKARPVQ